MNMGVVTGDAAVSIPTVFSLVVGVVSCHDNNAHSNDRLWFRCAGSGIRYSLVSQQSAYSSAESSPTGMAVGVVTCLVVIGIKTIVSTFACLKMLLLRFSICN